MDMKEVSQIHKKWTQGLNEFFPFFKNNQLLSLRDYSPNEVIEYKINEDLKAQIEQVLSSYEVSTSLFIIEHENPLLCSLILNNYFNIKPILVMNNFVGNPHSFINNGNYIDELYNVSTSLFNNVNPKSYAFVTYTRRFKLYYGDNFDPSKYFMNEYEISEYDLPDEAFIKKYTSFERIVYIADNEFTNEDIDEFLHYYEKHFVVNRHFITNNNKIKTQGGL